jgi:hypothetical protein
MSSALDALPGMATKASRILRCTAAARILNLTRDVDRGAANCGLLTCPACGRHSGWLLSRYRNRILDLIRTLQAVGSVRGGVHQRTLMGFTLTNPILDIPWDPDLLRAQAVVHNAARAHFRDEVDWFRETWHREVGGTRRKRRPPFTFAITIIGCGLGGNLHDHGLTYGQPITLTRLRETWTRGWDKATRRLECGKFNNAAEAAVDRKLIPLLRAPAGQLLHADLSHPKAGETTEEFVAKILIYAGRPMVTGEGAEADVERASAIEYALHDQRRSVAWGMLHGWEPDESAARVTNHRSAAQADLEEARGAGLDDVRRPEATDRDKSKGPEPLPSPDLTGVLRWIVARLAEMTALLHTVLSRSRRQFTCLSFRRGIPRGKPAHAFESSTYAEPSRGLPPVRGPPRVRVIQWVRVSESIGYSKSLSIVGLPDARRVRSSV